MRFTFPGSRYLEQFDPGHAVHYGVVVMMIGFTGFGLCLSSGHFKEMAGMVTASFFGAVSILSLVFIMAHHQNSTALDFKVPLVPVVPALSLLINALMMLHLAPITWLRLAFWMILGLSIYFIYGIRHSREELMPSSPDARFSKSSTYESVVSATTAGSGS
ncbi:Cationic amino acid transporter 3 domain protein [Trichostrongylus colubriformis]|uniref:Cationic amino acid transporter 3 domain protein n=1 Tax=Trichostrongylus colubriformis TaxID=6319 RepID=A0AAN8F9A4_TRICO